MAQTTAKVKFRYTRNESGDLIYKVKIRQGPAPVIPDELDDWRFSPLREKEIVNKIHERAACVRNREMAAAEEISDLLMRRGVQVSGGFYWEEMSYSWKYRLPYYDELLLDNGTNAELISRQVKLSCRDP